MAPPCSSSALVLALAALLVAGAGASPPGVDPQTARCKDLLARTNAMCDPADGNLATCCSTLHLMTLHEDCLCEKPTLSLQPGLVQRLLTLQEMCVDSLQWDPSERIRTDCRKEVSVDWDDVAAMMDEDLEDYYEDPADPLRVFRQEARATGSEDSEDSEEAGLYPTDSGDDCEEDDLLCQSLMKAMREHEAYESFMEAADSADRAEEERGEDSSYESLGATFSDFLEKEVATGDAALEIADTLYSWAAGMLRDIKQVASAMDVFGAFGMSLESIDIEVEASEDDSAAAEDEDDVDIDIDIEIEMEGDDIGSVEALRDAVLELDLEIDDSLTAEQLRKLPAKIAKALGKASLPAELMAELPALVQQAAQKGALGGSRPAGELGASSGYFKLDDDSDDDEDEADYFDDDKSDDDDGLAALMAGDLDFVTEYSPRPSGASSTEVDATVDDDGEGRYWGHAEAAPRQQPQWQPRQTVEHKVPITLKAAASLTPLTVESDAPIRLEMNPDDPEELFIIIETEDDEELVLTLENESGEPVSLVVEDDVSNQEASFDLLSGNSAIIRAGDAADKGSGLSLDLVPYLLDDFQQVTEAVPPLRRAAPARMKEFSLEVTATHEVRVHNWQGDWGLLARQEIELTVQATGPGAAVAEGGDVVDIVIDLDSGLGEGYGAGDEDRITIELELQVESAEDLDITVDIARAVTEERTGGEADPYVVINHLQDYIFRLECVFVLVYTTVCLALMAIFYYLYQLFTAVEGADDEEEEEEDEDEEAASLAGAASEMIAGAQTTLNVLFARDLSSEQQKAACAEGFYAQLPEGEAHKTKQ